MIKRCGRATALCGLLAAWGLQAEPVPFRQIHRVFGDAVTAEKLEAVRARYPRAFDDGIIVSTFVDTAIGSPSVKPFSAHRTFSEAFRGRDVSVQICLSTTIGHNDDWTVTNDLPKMVGSDGKTAKAVRCPRSPAFHANLRDQFRRYAELKPSVIWFDDDFRMEMHGTADRGCFCTDCLARFRRETGVALGRAELVKAILADATVSGVRVRRAWRDYSSRALTELAVTAAEAVHAVDDSIALGYMACNLQGRGYAPPDFQAWAAKTKNRDGVVYFRHGSGTYTDFTPYGTDSIVFKNVAIARMCALAEGPGVVNLTEEVTYPYTRRSKSMKITFLEVALSIGMAGADGVTYDAIKPNLDEQLRDDAVVAEMHRRDPELQHLHALVRGKRQIGVYPHFSTDLWLENGACRSFDRMEPQPRGTEVWRSLLYIGVPFSFREKDAQVLLLSRRAALGMPKERLAAWTKRAVIADQTAADDLDRILGKGTSASPRVAVYRRPYWDMDVWSRKTSLWVKDRLDALAGGRMPTRVDTAVRLAQSAWESADGDERAVFLFNLDFDDATDARLTLDGRYRAEVLDAATGRFTAIGEGDTFRLPTIPAWSPLAVRLHRIR